MLKKKLGISFGVLALFAANAFSNPILSDSQNTLNAFETQRGVGKKIEQGEIASLLIGINYERSSAELSNCINDIDHVLNYVLKPVLRVKKEHTIYMSDKDIGTEFYPTKKNILKKISEFVSLVNQSKKGYFHYSGHGSRVKDVSKDEVDGYDEALVPVDYETSGFILDDEMFSHMVKNLSSDVRLIVTTDCCHSGTILDLPYKWDSYGRLTIEQKISSLQAQNLPEIIMISGCKDNQTSADGGPITVNGDGSGALTGAFLKILKDYKFKITYRQLLLEVNRYLMLNGFTQRPELSSTRVLNLDDYYIPPKRELVLAN